MSLITRCPACGTMFKVVPDQLRISDGWVRCGHCAEIFDASANLQADLQADGPHAPAPAHDPPAADDAAPPDTPEESQGFSSSLDTDAAEAAAQDAPDSAQIEAEAQALRETPLDQPFALRRQDDSDMAAPALPEPAPARPEPARVVEPEPEPELHDLSFVRKARSQDFWRHPGMRALMLVLVLVLGLLLAGQIGLHDRDRIAATEPALRPLLSRLCEPLGCRISPPRQIDMLVIESSSFNKLRGEAYRLNFSVKNQAAMPVALPSLELTLTDGQDQAVIRRVLSPEDVGATASVIFPSADWSGSVTIAANGSGARIAGYRLLAFYP